MVVWPFSLPKRFTGAMRSGAAAGLSNSIYPWPPTGPFASPTVKACAADATKTAATATAAIVNARDIVRFFIVRFIGGLDVPSCLEPDSEQHNMAAERQQPVWLQSDSSLVYLKTELFHRVRVISFLRACPAHSRIGVRTCAARSSHGRGIRVSAGLSSGSEDVESRARMTSLGHVTALDPGFRGGERIWTQLYSTFKPSFSAGPPHFFSSPAISAA